MKLFKCSFLLFFLFCSDPEPQYIPVKENPMREFKQNLNDIYILKPDDRRRLFDCTKERDGYATPQETPLIVRHENMNMFEYPPKDSLTGLLRVDKNFAMLLYIKNFRNVRLGNRKVFIGIRGLGWGVHKSSLTKIMIEDVAKEYPDDIILLVDDYAVLNREKTLEHANVTSICHNNVYNDIMVGNKWPVFKDGMAWAMYHNFFHHTDSLHIIGYSNGSSPRHQMIETVTTYDKPLHNNPTLSEIAEYSQKSEYKYGINNVARIKSMYDIETNYSSGKAMWDLMKVLYDFYYKANRNRFYYATFILDNNQISSSVVLNHLMIIKTFNLKGIQLNNGFIRYENPRRTIVIDILIDQARTYRRGNIDLASETDIMLKGQIDFRPDLNHANIGLHTVGSYLNGLRAVSY